MSPAPASRRFPDRAALLVTVLVVAAWAHAGPGDAAPEVVRARRFELVDDQGRVRAALGTAEGDGARLMLYDAKGRHRVALAVHGDEAPGLELFTEEGSHAAELRHMNGAPLLSLYGAEGTTRLRLAVPEGPAARASVSVLTVDGHVETTWPAPAPPR